ncbi:hypothetical protein GW891_04165 [bacterium]|nr:hypothetical protein [bacterium]
MLYPERLNLFLKNLLIQSSQSLSDKVLPHLSTSSHLIINNLISFHKKINGKIIILYIKIYLLRSIFFTKLGYFEVITFIILSLLSFQLSSFIGVKFT